MQLLVVNLTLQEDQKEWVLYHKKKWQIQMKQRKAERSKRRRTDTEGRGDTGVGGLVRHGGSGVGDFLRRKARSMYDQPWQIVQVSGHMIVAGDRGGGLVRHEGSDGGDFPR